MEFLIACIIGAFIILPISIVYVLGKKVEKEQIKKSDILFNAAISERSVTDKEVFVALEESGIKISFIKP